ncbi:hypothetical protein COX03_01340 [Candidatus Woesebacteria bacterium CG22_combo_CG10-13_8_21_14_all_39_10]|uniref:Uncharacterized protein n=4 Tax=Candidatus Woeseibacteriota TaxID=1752722 RepID=A0A2M7XAB9_9BACT|nr:MAG: hypothetical protein COX03_01340 [Candidatus Woesebacteria bacterium CG22_combo_CG10-13_8_21_14_all_39_10]PIU71799.1 MAG: hypothetical protein COS80_01210 [Candidatus Woesebacteria bacterium CG06_land_8_20_14_3_00_39_27]PIZ47083.1 MAG: hypothetical protein COY29_05685 [Candidatus Woesebacteria bacterium CG_4_10_14_0_2_um_filter_39_14]PJA43103.1 MAG: hypothetical protein CO176_00170 [Candidatus Woesebacteria bacterium CG_4_9_14_3_um_filter_39_10]
MVIKKDEKLAKFFADSFKEVVLPSLDKLQDKVDNVITDVAEMRENMATKTDLYRVEEKLEKIDDRLERQGKVQDDLQERVEVLETHAPVIA